jgi:hypothetical protein
MAAAAMACHPAFLGNMNLSLRTKKLMRNDPVEFATASPPRPSRRWRERTALSSVLLRAIP